MKKELCIIIDFKFYSFYTLIMEKTLSGLQNIDLDYATIYDLDVDNILVENLSCINASFTNLSSIICVLIILVLIIH